MEENSIEAVTLARDVSATLDFSMLKKVITISHDIKENRKPNYSLIVGIEEEQENIWKRQLDLNTLSAECGYSYYLLSARLLDIDPTLKDRYYVSDREKYIWECFKKSCSCIEIVKDDILQQVHFRVQAADSIREEVKEIIKWNSDRSSATSKLRDLIYWGKDILNVVPHQKKLHENKFFK